MDFKHRSNFTLIELLVVIAIIAILAAMLLPVLNGARERSKSSNCISRQKQIVMAVMGYADGHDGFRPALTTKDENNKTVYYCGLLIKLELITKNAVLHCPKFPDATVSRNADTINKTYGLLREGPYDATGKRHASDEFVKINSISPAQDVMTVDMVMLDGEIPTYLASKADSARAIYACHNKQLNAGFYDGHIGTHTAEGLSELRSFRGKQPMKTYKVFTESGEMSGGKKVPVQYTMPAEI